MILTLDINIIIDWVSLLTVSLTLKVILIERVVIVLIIVKAVMIAIIVNIAIVIVEINIHIVAVCVISIRAKEILALNT